MPRAYYADDLGRCNRERLQLARTVRILAVVGLLALLALLGWFVRHGLHGNLAERAADFLARPQSLREVFVLVLLFTGYALYGGLVVGAGYATLQLVAQMVDHTPVW